MSSKKLANLLGRMDLIGSSSLGAKMATAPQTSQKSKCDSNSKDDFRASKDYVRACAKVYQVQLTPSKYFWAKTFIFLPHISMQLRS